MIRIILSILCHVRLSRGYCCLVALGCWSGTVVGADPPRTAPVANPLESIVDDALLSSTGLPSLVNCCSSEKGIVRESSDAGLPPRAHRQHGGKSDYYFVLPPCPVNQYTSGEIIAVPVDASPVLSATLKKGSAPAGTVLFPNGCLVVIDPTQLHAGTYRFAVETADQDGNTATHALTVKLKPSGKEDVDAMYTVRPQKALDQYVQGDVLAASHDRDGEIVHSEFVKGNLPTGTSLTSDGKVVVDDASQLQPGQYAAWITTEDKRGGTTLFIITLSL